MTKKVLYFEGAGMDYEKHEHSNVGNYRIRTAFYNNDGIAYYIELGRTPRRNEKHKVTSEWGLRIDHLFKLAEGTETHYDVRNWKDLAELDYTTEAITKWINKHLNCSFDTIEVLDRFHGYHVHRNSTYNTERGFNMMDNLHIDRKRAAKRKQAYELLEKEYKEHTGSKYSNISLMEMGTHSITVRCHASTEALGDKARTRTVEVI